MREGRERGKAQIDPRLPGHGESLPDLMPYPVGRNNNNLLIEKMVTAEFCEEGGDAVQINPR